MPHAPLPRVVCVTLLVVVISLLYPTAAHAERVRRAVVVRILEVGHTDQFFLKGRFRDPYARGRVLIEQRVNSGRWRPFDRIRTSPSSRYRVRVAYRGTTGTVTCYRLVVPGDRTHRRMRVHRANAGRYAGHRLCIETTFG